MRYFVRIANCECTGLQVSLVLAEVHVRWEGRAKERKLSVNRCVRKLIVQIWPTPRKLSILGVHSSPPLQSPWFTFRLESHNVRGPRIAITSVQITCDPQQSKTKTFIISVQVSSISLWGVYISTSAHQSSQLMSTRRGTFAKYFISCESKVACKVSKNVPESLKS